MSKLKEWCDSQPEWARDALHRAASVDEISQDEVSAVAARVAEAHGIAAAGEHPCQIFSTESLKPGKFGADNVRLCSIGPLEGVDRLADDQELKFALGGVTLIFGDNASGKSGYVRSLRQVCHARVASPLRNDVFANLGQSRPIRVSYTYQEGEAEPLKKIWATDEPRPFELSGITVFDTENARVYVEGENEILFLPPEINCLTRLGKLYTLVAAKFQSDADAIGAACGGTFGTLYDAKSKAGLLVQKLTLQTGSAELPTEGQLTAAGEWNGGLAIELQEIEAQLGQSPAVTAARHLRAATVLGTIDTQLRELLVQVDDTAINSAKREQEEQTRTGEVADKLAAEQIGDQPIAATGTDAWKRLYLYAREFAAEAGLRATDEQFRIGDPCPVCQRPLDDESAKRLMAFDAFVAGKANSDAASAAHAVTSRVAVLRRLVVRSDEDLSQLLAEYASTGEEARQLSNSLIEFNAWIRNRRDRLLECLTKGQSAGFEAMPASPLELVTDTKSLLSTEAKELLAGAGADASLTERVKELRDQQRLHDQLAEVLERRHLLDLRLKQLRCVAALSTLPVSRLASSIRKELVTPELSKRMSDELDGLALSHIPLKFGEKTEKGTSFFEVALATDKRADKESILSEGEQRALSVACFLAESHIAGRSSAIVFDDPVTSLDHRRMRKVAERLMREAATGRQIIIFTHNMLFYQEVLRACAELDPQVPVLPCLVRQHSEDRFGLITNDDKPWVAKKVKEREQVLEEKLRAIPDGLAPDSDELRREATSFYAELRETWERAVEEILLNAVIERFGTDVRTQSLKGVEVTDEDYRIVFNGMKRSSEYSGHDRAAARQLDPPSKDQMRRDLDELRAFRATRQKRRNELQEERKKLEEAPPAKTI